MFLAGLLLLLFSSPAFTSADSVFSDIADLSAAEKSAVEELHRLGVIEGYPDGSFRPQSPVSRAELAKMICVYAGQGG